MMKLSEKGIDLLKWIEQLRLKPYDDQTGKPIQGWLPGATIGYGHLIHQPDWTLYKGGIDENEADELFEEDLVPRENIVNNTIKLPMTQNEFDALVIFLYNLGTAQFKTSSAVKLINEPFAKTNFSGLEAAWKAFNKSQGRLNAGLINRRAAEWKIYSKDIYERW